MNKLKKQLETASNTIDNLSTRTRAINRKLQGVEMLPEGKAMLKLSTFPDAEVEDESDVEEQKTA